MRRKAFGYILLAILSGWLSIPRPALCGSADQVRFYVDGLPPYAVVHPHGPPTGFAVELMGEMMRAVGERFDPDGVMVMNWARAIHHVETAPDTCLLILARLPERLGRYKWVGPLDELPIWVIAHKDAGVAVNRVEDLLNYRVGMVRDTAPHHVLIRELPGIGQNLVLVSGIPALLRMLREGRVDVVIQATEAARTRMVREGMDTDEYAAVFMFGKMPIYFGFNQSVDDAFLGRLQTALDRLKEPDGSGSSPYERMRAKYFPGEASLDGGQGAVR